LRSCCSSQPSAVVAAEGSEGFSELTCFQAVAKWSSRLPAHTRAFLQASRQFDSGSSDDPPADRVEALDFGYRGKRRVRQTGPGGLIRAESRSRSRLSTSWPSRSAQRSKGQRNGADGNIPGHGCPGAQQPPRSFRQLDRLLTVPCLQRCRPARIRRGTQGPRRVSRRVGRIGGPGISPRERQDLPSS